jgi:hypothetical protein
VGTGTARVARVRAAERAAGDRPSQDRVVLLPSAVAVLDGASAVDASARDGGWYAEVLAEELAARLESDLDLRTVLADAISAVTTRHRLVPGGSPSSTVTVLRWGPEVLEGLVLGDSPLVVVHRDGRVEVVVDERLQTVAPAQRVAYHDRLAAGGGYDDGHRDLLRALVGEQRRHRNAPGGYWIAEASPAAAREALVRRWSTSDVTVALLASDGVSRGLGHPFDGWPALVAVATTAGPQAVLDAVRAAEDADPDGARWARSKRHDDQALVLVDWPDRPGRSPAPEPAGA